MSTNLNKATPSNFELIFPVIPTENNIRATESLTLNIHETVIPSLTLATNEIPWQGGKFHMEIGDITYEPWYVNFTVDSKFSNWRTLHKWLTFINNNKDTYSRRTNEYKVDATLRVLDNFRNEIFVVDLMGMWINMVGQIGLTYREGSTNLESSANFMYDRYEVRNIE